MTLTRLAATAITLLCASCAATGADRAPPADAPAEPAVVATPEAEPEPPAAAPATPLEAEAATLKSLSRALDAALQREDFAGARRLLTEVDALADRVTAAAVAPGVATPEFHVVQAWWGMGTRWSDVTEKARTLAKAGGLSSRVDHRVWGDPAPHWKKTLFVVYAHRGAIRTAVVAEDHAVTIP